MRAAVFLLDGYDVVCTGCRKTLYFTAGGDLATLATGELPGVDLWWLERYAFGVYSVGDCGLIDPKEMFHNIKINPS